MNTITIIRAFGHTWSFIPMCLRAKLEEVSQTSFAPNYPENIKSAIENNLLYVSKTVLDMCFIN